MEQKEITDIEKLQNEKMTIGKKALIALTHLCGFLGGAIFLPIILYFIKKSKPDVVLDHIKTSINFQITLYLLTVVGVMLTSFSIGNFVLAFLSFVSLFLPIYATVKGFLGDKYAYPFVIKFFK